MSSYTLTTTRGTHPLYNLMWRWYDHDKWRVKNIPAWHWESFLGFTCLYFDLKCCTAYSIKGWEAMSLNFRSLESRHCCRRRYSVTVVFAAVIEATVALLPLLILDHRRTPSSILSPPSLATFDGLPPSLATVDGLPLSLATATTPTRNLPYVNGYTELLLHFKS